MRHAQSVTILNGPAGCGKDTLAALVQPAAQVEFKDSLYYETAQYYGIYIDAFKEACADRERKEAPYFCVQTFKRFSLSPRQMLIHVSEEVIKPEYGKGYFGEAAAREWIGKCCPLIASDGGFPDEVLPITDTFGCDNVLVIRLHRDGYNFVGDSRSYIQEDDVNCRVVDVVLRDGEIDEAVKHIEFLRERFL